MANYHILKIDSLIESLTLCNTENGFRFQFDFAEDAVTSAGDLIMGYLTSPIDEIRYIFEVVSTADDSIVMVKKCEVSDGIQVDLSTITELQPYEYTKEFMTITANTFNRLKSRLFDAVLGNGGSKKSDDIVSADQIIYYGCPGTGKSRTVKKLTGGLEDEKLVNFDERGEKVADISKVQDKSKITTNVFRTTFHPDYDYSSFVGSYKPVMKPIRDENGEETDKEELVYDFVPQVFLNAYVRAHKSLKDTKLTKEEQKVHLIIEEINRGNCAQIFGDLFQLLDRKDGKSEFPIIPDAEIRKHLRKEGIECNTLALPPNLHIYATMNTSDQSLFPMDSAFKRRWAMKYVPIDLKNEKAMTFRFTVNDKLYSWVDFLGRVNPLIRSATESEDKQMGEFFIKESVTQEEFVNKVMFYLWNDVCKDLYSPNRIGKQYFLRSSDSEEKKDVFTFAELFGAGRFNEADKSYTKPVDLLEGFITKKLGLESVKKEPQQNNPDNE